MQSYRYYHILLLSLNDFLPRARYRLTKKA